MKKSVSLSIVFLSFLLSPGLLFSAERLQKIAGDAQMGIAGYPLREDFVVQVLDDGKPKPGAPVIFAVIEQPQQDSATKNSIEASLSSPLLVTGADGMARTRLNAGYPEAGDVIVTAATPSTVGSPAVFRASVYAKHWLLLIALGIIGGLGIFLFGMFYLNSGLHSATNQRFREVLVSLTSSNWRGIITGFFVTLFNQSSSATTLLEVSLVSAGILSFYQTMAVTMGAEIGSTITAQLVAFKLSEYSVFIAGIGFYISFFSRSKLGKQFGSIIFGFGMLFLGMKIMADLLMPLRSYGPFMDAMKHMSNPLYGILAGLVFTMLIHSSGATAGIVIALALAGAISLEQAIPLNLGAQVGTCITAALGSIGRGREGKRVALWHVFLQSAGVILIYPFLVLLYYKGEPSWIYFVKWFTATFIRTDDLARQIAMGHTLAAIINVMVFFPFLKLFNKALCVAFPPKEQEKPFGPIYIDEGLLVTPSLAMKQARKEVLREGEIVLEMMRESLKVFDSQDLKLCETVSLKDIRADVLHNAIVPYLTRLAQGSLTEEQSQQETRLLYVTADIEAIGDIIDKNIMPLARKKIENKLWFSDEGWEDIGKLHGRVVTNLEHALTALKDNNLELARLVADSKAEIDSYESELRKRHIGRLHSGLQESLETSSVHLDLIDQFKRINSHVADTGYSLLGQI
jgi:phosphate:Na+ symporter